MSTARIKVVAAALALLAGCAGPRPPLPAESKVEAPDAWRTQVRGAKPGLDVTWWDAFEDAGLRRVIAAALAGNDDIRIAASRVQEVMGQSDYVHAERFPQVDGSVILERDRSINQAYGVPQVQTVSEPGLTFSFDADLFGRLRNADEAGRANLLATRAAQEDIRLLVVATTARQWFTLRSLDARLATLRQTLVAREQSLSLVRRRVEVGYAAQLDLAQAESEYQGTLQQIPPTELAIRRTEDSLSILLGRNPSAIERNTAAAPPQLPAIPADLPSSLLRRRPDIVEAEEKIVAADHELDAARAAFMPDLKISAIWGRATSTLLHDGPVDLFTVGASVLAPIFDAGRLRAQEDSAAARRDQAAFAYRKTTLQAFAECEDALAATQRLHEQLEALHAQKRALQKSLEIASRRYRSGYSPFLDQLDAQRSLLSVELAIAQTTADELGAYVTLFQALGGGWDRSQLDGAAAGASAAATHS